MTLLILAKFADTKANENELDTDGGDGISGGRINDKIENLSSSKKVKRSSGIDFLTFEAKDGFSCL